MRRLAHAFILSALMASVPCAAQDPDGGEIVVEGAAPLDRDSVVARVREGYPDNVMRAPVMRYHDPICLQVNGLGPSGNAEVLGHMRETIRSLDIPLSPEGCRANAVVVVSVEPVAQLESIHRRTPRVLAADILREKSEEFGAGAHAIVWHNRTVRGSNGEQLAISGGIAGSSGLGGVTGLVNNNGRPSRIEAGYSLAADVGVVVYDATKLDNVDLRQLASNAVMRLLAPGFSIDVEPGSPATVLSGVEDGQGPHALTRFDRAMLSALYAMSPNQFGMTLGRAAARVYEREE